MSDILTPEQVERAIAIACDSPTFDVRLMAGCELLGHDVALRARLAAAEATISALASVLCPDKERTVDSDLLLERAKDREDLCHSLAHRLQTAEATIAGYLVAAGQMEHAAGCESMTGFVHCEPCPFWTRHYCLVNDKCAHGFAMGEACEECGCGSDLEFPEGAERCHPRPCTCPLRHFPNAEAIGRAAKAVGDAKWPKQLDLAARAMRAELERK